MTKQNYYTYLGTNGVLETPIALEGIYRIEKVLLTADKGKTLTKDNKTYYSQIMVGLNEVDLWKEVDEKGQK